jgi:hypothetical protein
VNHLKIETCDSVYNLSPMQEWCSKELSTFQLLYRRNEIMCHVCKHTPRFKNNHRQTYLIQRILWSLVFSCHKNKHLQPFTKVARSDLANQKQGNILNFSPKSKDEHTFKLYLHVSLRRLNQNLQATNTLLLSTGTRSSATCEIAINIEIIFICTSPT